MRRIVIAGHGPIGCGHLAPLFARAGWEVVLAARSPQVVRRIAAAGHFDVRTAGEGGAQRVAAEAVLVGSAAFDRAVAGAELLATADGAFAPGELGPPLARALAARGTGRPLDVWTVEDADVAPLLRGAVHAAAAELGAGPPAAGFAGAVAYATVTPGGRSAAGRPVLVAGGFRRLRVDAGPLVRGVPELPGVAATARYAEHLRDKRWVLDAGHALCAFLGTRRGHRLVHEAIGDPLIFGVVRASLEAARAALGPAGADAGGSVDAMLERFADARLRDPLARATGDPLVALAPDGPLAGPARLVAEATGGVPAGFAAGLAAAIGLVDGRRAAGVLRDVCALDPDGPLGREVRRLHAGWAAPPRRFARTASCAALAA